MAFCEHCEGQRFDRSRVLRTLRQLRRQLARGRGNAKVDAALAAALQAVRQLEIPHLETVENDPNEIVH